MGNGKKRAVAIYGRVSTEHEEQLAAIENNKTADAASFLHYRSGC